MKLLLIIYDLISRMIPKYRLQIGAELGNMAEDAEEQTPGNETSAIGFRVECDEDDE